MIEPECKLIRLTHEILQKAKRNSGLGGEQLQRVLQF